ncbi:MAG: aminotransferase DegT, partial [Proteobacteria bacterium]|nr:aminotransferase DegT [Pseudomonadota bacterium]
FTLEKFSAFQADLALNWSKRLSEFRKTRSKNAARYAGCYGIPLHGGFRSIPDLIRFPVLTESRAAKMRLLENSALQGLGVADAYPDTIDGIAGLVTGGAAGRFPEAKNIVERLVTLPLHQFVREGDQGRIAELINNGGRNRV